MKRSIIPEIMDQPGLDRHDHETALFGLRRLNIWTRNYALAWRYMEHEVRNLPKPARVLDVATGSADLPISLFHRSQKSAFPMDFSATDFSAQAIAIAEQECAKRNATIRLFQHDIVQSEIPGKYDIVLCSQFLHHLEEEQAVLALQRMRRAATRGVILMDLCRSRWNLIQVWLATRILSRSPIVHFDGPQSVRAAFRVGEMKSLAERAGFQHFRIRQHWPCRFVFVGEIHAN